MINIKIEYNLMGGSCVDEQFLEIECDNQTIITLLDNNHVYKEGCKLLGWATNDITKEGTKPTSIYKGIYIPDTDVILYAVWGEENPSNTLNIEFNNNKTTSVTTIPYEKLNEDEKLKATNSILNKTKSIVTFCYKNDEETKKFDVEYEGTEWTLSQIITENEYTNEFENFNKKITWYRKSVMLNDYDKIYDGDVLIGEVFDGTPVNFIALPIVIWDDDERNNLINILNTDYGIEKGNEGISLSNKLFHTKSPNEGLSARYYGYVNIVNNDDYKIEFDSLNDENNTIRVPQLQLPQGNNYTLFAEPLDGCRFVGWFRREEYLEEDGQSGKVNFYPISGESNNKLNVIVEKNAIFNQYGACFIGEPKSTEKPFAEYKFKYVQPVQYYTWSGTTTDGIYVVDKLEEQFSSNEIVIQNEGEIKSIFIFSKIDLTNKKFSNDKYEIESSVIDIHDKDKGYNLDNIELPDDFIYGTVLTLKETIKGPLSITIND